MDVLLDAYPTDSDTDEEYLSAAEVDKRRRKRVNLALQRQAQADKAARLADPPTLTEGTIIHESHKFGRCLCCSPVCPIYITFISLHNIFVHSLKIHVYSLHIYKTLLYIHNV